jgi:hypothetical protein
LVINFAPGQCSTLNKMLCYRALKSRPQLHLAPRDFAVRRRRVLGLTNRICDWPATGESTERDGAGWLDRSVRRRRNMKSMFSTAVAVVTTLAAAGGWLASGAGSASAGIFDKFTTYTYAVKYVCSAIDGSGPPQGVAGFGQENARYATLINVHNPNHETADVCVKGVDAPTPQAMGGAFEIGLRTLFDVDPDGGFAMSCRRIALLPSSGGTTNHSDGFVVFESRKRLDVVATYTVQRLTQDSGTDEFTNSVDVEYVQPTEQRASNFTPCEVLQPEDYDPE